METTRPSISASLILLIPGRSLGIPIIYDYLRPAWGEYGGLS